MRLAIPLEPRFRVSVHTFRWGLHVKLRRWHLWRHFVVKVVRGSAFGRPGARLEFWIGWWRSEKGVRHPFHGVQLRLVRVRRYTPKGSKVAPQARIPIYPHNERLKQREFEIR